VSLVGDEVAYAWFRPKVARSNVLTSALMAVETWAVLQIRSGINAGDVVDNLLTGTRALAFLGIAVGLGYDFPVLRPELVDAVARPWLWRLEFERQAADRMPDGMAFLPAEFQWPRYKPHLHERNSARDADRVQDRMVLLYAVNYLFASGSEVREAFLSRRSEQQLPDATLFVEEAAMAETSTPARETFDTFLAVTDAQNFIVDKSEVRFNPPASMQPSAEQQRLAALRQAMLIRDFMGARSLLDYQIPEGLDAYERVGQSVQAELDKGTFTGQDLEYARSARVRCAAVAVTQLPRVGRAPNAWSEGVVRDAVACYDANDWQAQEDDSQVTDLRLSVGTALGAMLAAHPDDVLLRTWAFRAAAVAPRGTATSVLRGLIPAWQVCPQTPMNILTALATVALRYRPDRPGSLEANEIEELIGLDGEGQAYPLPDLSSGLSRSAAFRLEGILKNLPGGFASARAMELLEPLAVALVDLVRVAGNDERNEGIQILLWQLAPLCANLIIDLPAHQYRRLLNIVSDWQNAPGLYAHVIRSVVLGKLVYTDASDEAFERFFELAAPFLGGDHHGPLQREHLTREFRDACWHLVFVQEMTGVMVPQGWPHAAKVVRHIDRWTAALGGHPTNAAALLNFLDPRHGVFSPETVVGWLETCLRQTPAHLRSAFWLRNGAAVATALAAIISNPDLSSPFRDRIGQLVDDIVSAGVPSGGELRRRLECLAI
jgi:hypothetical protein